MPKIVDADERRAYIARACYRLIARDGLEGLSTRALAREAHISAGALFHYFDDKDAIVFAAYQLLADTFRDELRERVKDARDARERLRLVALSNIPIEGGRRPEFSAWLSMWAVAVGNDKLRTYQADLYENWREVLEALANDAIEAGLLAPSPNARQMSLHIAALTDGFAVQILMAKYPNEIANRATDVLDVLLDQWSVAPHAAALPLT